MALLKFGKIASALAAGGTGATAFYIAKGDDPGFIRFGRAAVTGAKIIVDYKLTFRKLPQDGDSEEYKTMMSDVHLRSANRLLSLCCKNGGCFIKVGQHVGSLDYLLPKEYVNTMKVLHSEAPESSKAEVLEVLKQDLSEEAFDQIQDFAEKPIGTASLAQVHKATLKDGTVVAMKVQHSKVKANSFVDINTMEVLVKTVAWVFPGFSFTWLAEEMRRNLPLELDFEYEGKNAERVSNMLNYVSFLKVPKIYWGMSSERVLTMEFCEGGRADDRDYMMSNNIPVEEVSNNLSYLYSEMIFKHGFVHCDPHPGNVLVKKTKEHHAQIVLLDHGLYTSLTDDFRLNYAQLWMSIIRADETGMKTHSEAMNCGDLYGLFSCMVAGRAWSSISTRKLNTGVVNPRSEEKEIQDNAAGLLFEMVQVLSKLTGVQSVCFTDPNMIPRMLSMMVLFGIGMVTAVQGADDSIPDRPVISSTLNRLKIEGVCEAMYPVIDSKDPSSALFRNLLCEGGLSSLKLSLNFFDGVSCKACVESVRESLDWGCKIGCVTSTKFVPQLAVLPVSATKIGCGVCCEASLATIEKYAVHIPKKVCQWMKACPADKPLLWTAHDGTGTLSSQQQLRRNEF